MVFSSLVFIYLFLPLCLMYYIFPNIKTKIFFCYLCHCFLPGGACLGDSVAFSGTIDYFHGLIIKIPINGKVKQQLFHL